MQPPIFCVRVEQAQHRQAFAPVCVVESVEDSQLQVCVQPQEGVHCCPGVLHRESSIGKTMQHRWCLEQAVDSTYRVRKPKTALTPEAGTVAARWKGWGQGGVGAGRVGRSGWIENRPARSGTRLDVDHCLAELRSVMEPLVSDLRRCDSDVCYSVVAIWLVLNMQTLHHRIFELALPVV